MNATRSLIFMAVLATSTMASAANAPLARVTLIHADGTGAGTAEVRTKGEQAVLVVKLKGVPAGDHGMHFHAVGSCEKPGFTSAGGHLNPAGRQHGTHNPEGSHMGDLPNVTANAAGKVSARIPLTVAPDALARTLFDADGTALVVHAKADDNMTDPAGNSGARIACGVLARP